MKGTYKSKLLVAVGFDASNRQFPLAFALVDEETNRSWSWFMSQLRHHVCREVENICVISDRHRGIMHAMKTLSEWKEPLAVHRYCLVHVQSNFTQKFRNQRLKDFVWAAGAANQAKKYEAFMERIWLLNEEAYKWLNGGSVKPEQWALCKDGGYRWGHTSTSVAKCFNNLLRKTRLLPITSCVQFTFNQIVDLFTKKRKMAFNAIYPFPKEIWRMFVANELKARTHSVKVYDHRNGIYCVTTGRRDNGKGVRHKLSTLEIERARVVNGQNFDSHARTLLRHVIDREQIHTI
nr:uncharacterized protein LOC113741929 [Coffea arabica]